MPLCHCDETSDEGFDRYKVGEIRNALLCDRAGILRSFFSSLKR